jgi:hypothetical protein
MCVVVADNRGAVWMPCVVWIDALISSDYRTTVVVLAVFIRVD